MRLTCDTVPAVPSRSPLALCVALKNGLVERADHDTAHINCLLTAEPIRHISRVKSDAGTDSKGWGTTFLGEFINDDPRDGEQSSQLCRRYRPTKSPDLIGEGDRLNFGHAAGRAFQYIKTV